MRKGFTLIEVLVVAVIVAILAAVAIPAYNSYIRSTKVDVGKNLAATLVQSAATYYSKFPTAAMAYTKADPAVQGAIQIGGSGDYDCIIPVSYTAIIGAAGAVTVKYYPGGVAPASVTTNDSWR